MPESPEDRRRRKLPGYDEALARMRGSYPANFRNRFDSAARRSEVQYAHDAEIYGPEQAEKNLATAIQEEFERPGTDFGREHTKPKSHAEIVAKQRRVRRYNELMEKTRRGEQIDRAHQQWLQQVHAQSQMPGDTLSSAEIKEIEEGEDALLRAPGELNMAPPQTPIPATPFVSPANMQLLVRKLAGY